MPINGVLCLRRMTGRTSTWKWTTGSFCARWSTSPPRTQSMNGFSTKERTWAYSRYKLDVSSPAHKYKKFGKGCFWTKSNYNMLDLIKIDLAASIYCLLFMINFHFYLKTRMIECLSILLKWGELISITMTEFAAECNNKAKTITSNLGVQIHIGKIHATVWVVLQWMF